MCAPASAPQRRAPALAAAVLAVPVPEDAWGRELTVLAAAPDASDMSMSTLIRLADEKMYRNKQEMKACRQA